MASFSMLMIPNFVPSIFVIAKGPFDTYSVGADKSEANVLKFSSDGRLMLLTTMGGHIHILDSFRGNLVSSFFICL